MNSRSNFSVSKAKNQKMAKNLLKTMGTKKQVWIWIMTSMARTMTWIKKMKKNRRKMSKKSKMHSTK
jgi:hypothetical protein